MYRSHLLRVPALLATLLLIAAIAASSPAHVVVEAAPAPPAIYVLRGGDAAADAAVIAALSAAGMHVTEGVAITAFTGAQANLGDYDAVVALYNQSWATPLQQPGMDAIADYVAAGGGLITGEFLIAQSGQAAMGRLRDLLPATSCGRRSGATTTLTVRGPNPIVNAGLPGSFSVSLSTFADNEGCLSPRADAAILYTSSNSGADAPGLAAWSVGQGRVASFSLLLGATELQSAALRRLLQNTVGWVAGTRDLTPPKIKSVALSSAGALTSSRQHQLTIQASDSGGARLGHLYVVEYRYSGDPQAPWQAVGRSGWLPFGAGDGKSLDWTISADPGVHYLQIFVADRAGNVTVSPGLSFLSYQPAVAAVATDEQRIYRVSPPTGSAVTVQLNVLSGNPDLYVFGPNISFAPGSDAPSESTSFTATGAVYQIEVEGHLAGSYQLQVSAGPAHSGDAGPLPDRRPRGSIITLAAEAPRPIDAQLPAPPADLTPAGAGDRLYLPLLTR